MTKRDRWLTSIAVLVSVLPLIIMAFILKLLPLNVALEGLPLLSAEKYLNKYVYLVTGVFCIVPLSIVLISYYIKRKMVVYSNYPAILVMSMLLSLTFSVIAIYGVFSKVENINIFIEFDFIGFLAVLVSMATALLGNLMRYRNPKSVLAIKNKYTKASSSVFKTVHNNASSVQTWLFIIVTVIISFTIGWHSWVIYGSAVISYIVWCYIYSRAVMKYFEKRKAEYERMRLDEQMRETVNEIKESNITAVP